ncbi:septum site-determining protein Ssd [Nocardiopsis sp. CNT312]|uniref:septum site-determining protein Ssd n=1 Tax=Nocardiopsis sp. CNT312 TaxID=1137268 RepID=UPI00048AC952|nr:septum site-determining protein Ssd [Nocardiopsis sp. CNT312]
MPRPAPPLIVTDDSDLLDDLLRLASAASVEVAVVRSADRAPHSWRHAPLVVVGLDLLPALAPPVPPQTVAVSRADTPLSPTGTDARTLLRLPGDEARMVGLLSDAATAHRPPTPVVSVMGGRGGAGTTLTALALALAGARGGRDTALLDSDPLGCGPDIYLGCDAVEPRGPRTGWDDLLRSDGRVRWSDLRGGLPGARGLSVLTWNRSPAARCRAPLSADTARAALDSAGHGTGLVVVDLPRAFTPATGVFLDRSDAVFVVVPADVPSVVAAAGIVPRVKEETPNASAVVVGAQGELSADVVAHTLGLPLGADLPPEPGIARLLAAGRAPARRRRSPLARFADRAVSGLCLPEAAR